MTYEDKASYESTPPYSKHDCEKSDLCVGVRTPRLHRHPRSHIAQWNLHDCNTQWVHVHYTMGARNTIK